MRNIITSVALGLAAGAGQAELRAAPPLSIYGQLPGFEKSVLSPTGDRVAIIGRVAGKRQLVVYDKDKKPLFAAPLGEEKIRGLYWIGEKDILVYKSDTVDLGVGFTSDQAELYSGLIFPIDGRKPWFVFQNNKSIVGGVRGFYGLYERQSKWYGYFGGITLESKGVAETYLKTTQPVLYEVDLTTGSARKIAARPENGVYRSWVLGPDGSVNATFDYISSSGNWAIRNAQGGKIATGTSKLGGAGLIGLGATGDSLLYSLTDDADGESRWFEVPLAGGEAKEILAGSDTEGSIIDRRTGRFIGYTIVSETPTYRFFDARKQKVINATLKAFPGLAVRLIDWNDSFDKLIVRTEGSGDPQSWWLVDIKTGQAMPLGQSYQIPEQEVGSVKMIRYKAGDGTEIAAVLTLPPGRDAKNLPVVIFPHGGPAAHDEVRFDWWAQAFAARGYAVLQPNFRGSTGYGPAFKRAGHGEWGGKMQTDISDGLAHLARDGIVDPKRACIMGASFGGYAALAGVTLQQEIYRCAVSVSGIGDVSKMVATDLAESGSDPTLRRSLEQQVGARRDLAAVSPIRFVDKVAAPILLIHGKDDTVVHYDQSRDMNAALRRAGKTVEFVTLAGEDHWLSKGSTRLNMLEAAVAFVEKHNPPGRAAGAEKTVTAATASRE